MSRHSKTSLPRSLLALLLLPLSFAFISHEVDAGMFGFFKRYGVHLSPEVRGVITENGTPLKNLEVYRTLDYEKEYVDKTRTDSNGRFSFPEKVIKSSRPGKLLDETRTRQVIGLFYGDKNYLLWYTTTGGTTPKRAISERLNTLNCDLTTPEEELVFENFEHPDFPHSAFSICRWD